MRALVLGSWMLLVAAMAAAGSSDTLDQAMLLLDQGRMEEALAALRQPGVVDGDPERRDLLEALLLHRLKRDVEAVEPLQRALARAPLDLEARLDLGQALQTGGRWDEARDQFEEAKRLYPRRAEPWLGLGQLAAGQALWREAQSSFEQALLRSPRCKEAWVGLSDVLLQLGQLRPAAEAREKALAEGGQDQELEFKQALAWYGLGDWDRSEDALHAAALGDEPRAFFLAGCLAHRRGRFAEAERDFLAAIGSGDGYAPARLNLGLTYYSEERYDEALTQFDAVSSMEEEGGEAATYRLAAAAAAADHYAEQGSQAWLAGDLPRALEALQRAESLAAPEEKPALQRLMQAMRAQQGPHAQRLDREARQALKAGKLPEAVLLWQDALRLDPDDAGALKGLESVKNDVGALKAAYVRAALAADDAEGPARSLALTQRLMALDPSAAGKLQEQLRGRRHGRVKKLLEAGRNDLEQGQPRRALEQFDQALAIDPEDRRAQTRRAQAQEAWQAQVSALLAQVLQAEAQGHWQEAYAHARQALETAPADLEAQQAVQRLAKRLDLKRDAGRKAEDLYYQGVYAYGAGDTQRAIALWQEGLRLEPAHGPLKEALRSADLKLKSLASLEGS